MRILDGLLEAVFPPVCAACERCGREPFCRLCAEALVAAEPLEVPGLDHVVAAYAYGGPVAEAVRRFKYGRRPDLGRALAPALSAVRPPGADVLVPIPSTPRRLRTRGFSPPLELARNLGPTILPRALARSEGPPQVGLSAPERRKNVAATFRVETPEAVAGRVVLLIDDVVTTGATLEFAAAALHAAGARVVLGLALARAEVGHDR